MVKNIQGNYDGKGLKISIVVSRFNSTITEKLLDGAVDCLSRHGVEKENIFVYWVPGAFEIPSVARKLALQKNSDAVICLGCVIRGDTPHFDYIASEVSKGVAQVSLEASIPVVFGVLTTDTIEQAIERSGTKFGNKGFDAALASIEMVNLLKQI